MPSAVVNRLTLVSAVLLLLSLFSLGVDYRTYPLTPAPTALVSETVSTPWAGMVLLYAESSDFSMACSGFLLSSTLVATAGHCLEGASTVRLYPGAYRNEKGLQTPYGECRSNSLLLAPNYSVDPLRSDYGAFHVEECDPSMLNPAGISAIGELTGHYDLVSLPGTALEDLPVSAAGYPGSLAMGSLQLSEGTVRSLGCELRRSWMCSERWNLTASMSTPPGHSGGVLVRRGTLEVVGVLTSWSAERNESLFRRVDAEVLAQYLSWEKMSSDETSSLTE